MRVFTCALFVSVLVLWGCAATPNSVKKRLVQQVPPEWPASVADTCPERRVSVECFRAEGLPWTAVNEAMEGRYEQLRACIRPDSELVKVKLTIETRGGSPSCVEASVWDKDLERFQSLSWLHDGLRSAGETARCAATIVARDLALPDSPPDEHCRWSTPLHLSWD